MINYKERKQALEQLFQQLSSRLRQLDDEKNKATTEMVQIQGKLIMLKELEKESEPKVTKANEDKTTPPQPENDKAEEAAKEAEVKADEKTKEETKPEQEKKDK